MKKPKVKQDNPADTLIEFAKVIGTIKATPENIKKNSDKMTVGSEVIAY